MDPIKRRTSPICIIVLAKAGSLKKVVPRKKLKNPILKSAPATTALKVNQHLPADSFGYEVGEI